MHNFLLAIAGVAALIPATASAQRPIVNDGSYPIPDVRIRPPANVMDRFDRRDYRGGVASGDYGYNDYGAPYQRYRFHPEDRDADYPERVVRDGDRELAYDRDYPFEYRYGGEGACGPGGANCRDDPYYDEDAYASYGRDAYGSGGYTVTETIVTTMEPSTIQRRSVRRSRR